MPSVCLCKRTGANQWFHGEEAKKAAANFQGTLVDDLLSLALKGEPVRGILPEKICEAAGVSPEHIKIADPGDPDMLEKTIKAELEVDEPSVVIVRRPCVLLKKVVKDSYCEVNTEKCKKCRACMQIGCPAIMCEKGKSPVVDTTICTGCGLCTKMCRFDAFETIKKQGK